ncbi:NAD(P)H-binding protein [Agromyces mariniharenae]|uniref:NAD(P)H-binding protein n=1 Tax=Agromyces mariniharenae TaxID=2604423 RepID=A0A5S4V9G8_9MICO|nr:NAD(P)H-binding protein [Agromyces mariniharenae]TYL53971.1 NAD(P)H-binding protein [Agromyces mariniharenae]
MRVVIAGGHGKIALILERLLVEAGHEPIAIIRNPEHRADVDATGASAVVLDLEDASVSEVGQVLKDADAAVFAAGAGPGSTAERKFTVDRDAAILLADAAEAAGVPRLIVISAIDTDRFDPDSQDIFQLYLRAKSEADASVRSRDLDWTIVRPGSLVNDAGTGRIRAADVVPGGGRIPRADVAAIIASLLETGAASRTQFEVVSGDDPIDGALAALG